MSADVAHKIVSSLRRSERCKNTRVIYNDDYEEDSETEISYSEEVASPSPSELNVASVDDKSGEQDFRNVSLGERTWFEVENKKAPKTISEGSGTKDQSQCGGLGVERSNEEVDLDEPLIALKQKKKKIPGSKAKRKTDASSSPHATKPVESTKRDGISHVQTSLFESTLHGSVTQKLERRAADQEHSRIAIEHTCDHLSVVLHQFPIKDNECGQQPGFITQPTEPDVSDAKAHLHDSVEQKKTDNNFSSLGPIDEVSNHQKSLDDISNYTDMRCTSVVMQPDSCGSTDRICTSHEEVVQMPVEGQLDSLVCHGVKTKDTLLHMNAEQAATGYNFAFDKTLDLFHTANFDIQDGRLENIVYGALNNNVQRKCFETKTSVGVPDTVVTLSSPTAANVSHDGCLLLANMEGSTKDMNQLSGTMNVDICRSANDQESREAYVVQQKLFQACGDMGKAGHAISDSSSNPEETQEISDGQTRASDFFIDEGSIEDHTPRKLLSQRKIMSPTSQEKFCNALAGIDLCGVQRLERKINLEDCDVSSQALPQTTNKQYRSVLTTDRKLKSRTSISFTSKGILKSTESPSPQLTNSSVLLDTEKAVEFSQRQMHDIESIAANLIRSLKHMRSLVDENLSSEAHSLLPNFNTAEMRAASEDALKVERTTKKWLTIMNKDCNRFCKILTLEGKKAVSHPEVPRKRRKITFADEAGGTLCYVNVFSDVQTSPACEGEL